MSKAKGSRKSGIRRLSRMRGAALAGDLFIIAIGIFIAYILVRLGAVDFFVNAVHGYHAVASFIAGIFFTSAFTLAPASIALSRIAETAPISSVALWGALGALVGDMILFFFVKDKFYDDLIKAIKPSVRHHIFRSFHLGFLKWLSPVIGALIIASPLPDELGIALLGASKVKLSVLVPIAFVMNMIGICLLLGLVHIFF